MSTNEEKIRAQRGAYENAPYPSSWRRHLMGPDELAYLLQDKEFLQLKVERLSRMLNEARNEAFNAEINEAITTGER